jgi:iron complex outermembrane recepter protein
MRIAILSAVILFSYLHSVAQEIVRDTTLREIIVQAYNAERMVDKVAASVAVVDRELLGHFHNFSLVPAMNTVPGVRMEERSPGSYRFAIRGSSIRSPFGVRNVKIYLNGLPFTDAGGNTYLNLIDPSGLSEIEIIKGPGGSLYGAGTGGVVLLKKSAPKNDAINMSAQIGSYGSQRYLVDATLVSEKIKSSFNFAHQQSNGYRQQSASEREAWSGIVDFELGEFGVLSANILYTDIFYQTPGGLTFNEYNSNPSAARAQAVEKKASVYNKTVFLGITNNYAVNDKLNLTTSLFGGITKFENPSIREYEIRKEDNVGIRSLGSYALPIGDDKIIFTGGVEVQHLESPIQKFPNLSGSKGKMESHNDLSATSSMLFLQSEYEIASWVFTGALSANFYQISLDDDSTATHENRRFAPSYLPRVAVLKIMKRFSLYASFSRGFSPPSVGDLYPTGSEFNSDLEAEYGNNFEVGIKGDMSKPFYYEFTAYQFGLENTIVARESEFGYDYFVNAGKTDQSGLEFLMRAKILESNSQFLSFLRITGSYSYNDYVFKEYSNAFMDLSGNKIAGVAPTVIYAGLDAKIFNGIELNVSYNFLDHVPLNDENTAYAKSYHLLGSRIGYHNNLSKHKLEVYFGADNLLDKKYSLGNDINPFGGRYYNAAAPMNFYGGIKLNLNFRSGR